MQSTCSFNTYISLSVVLIVDNRARILINNKIFAPNFNVLFKCNASARYFGGHWMALWSRLLHTAVSSHLVSDGTSWDSSGSELFPQSQDLPASLLIRWVRLFSSSYLASALHFPFPYGHLEPCAYIYTRFHWCSMFPQLPLVSGIGGKSTHVLWNSAVHMNTMFIIWSQTPCNENKEAFLIHWVAVAVITASNAADSSCFPAVSKDWVCTVSFLCHALTPPSAYCKVHLFIIVTG